MFIYVSKSGRPYNRTDGKNDAINLGGSYPVGLNETVVFSCEDNALYVTKYTSDNRQGYRTEINKPGKYIVTGFCTMPLPSTPKENRIMYNRIKATINNRALFKIDPIDQLSVPFKLLLTVGKKFTRLELIFLVKANIKLCDPDVIDEIADLIEQTLSFEETILRSLINLDNITDTYITVNKDFISKAKEIERKLTHDNPQDL